ncbi:uncharacterized protein LOC144172622 [Haemaphysalis longicornis]
MQELPAEAKVPMAYSGSWLGGSQTRPQLPGGTRPACCVSKNRLSEREPPVNYGFVGLDGTATRICCKLPNHDFRKAELKRFVGLKRFKVCLGGCTDEGTLFVAPVVEQHTRVSVLGILVEWLQRNAFHGLAQCWMCPAPDHRVNFAVLISDLRSAWWREKLFMFAALHANTRLESYFVQSAYGNPGVVHGREPDNHHRCFSLATCASPGSSPLPRGRRQGQCGLLCVLGGTVLEAGKGSKPVLSVPYAGTSFPLRRDDSHRVGGAAAGPTLPRAGSDGRSVLSEGAAESVCLAHAGSAATTARMPAC